LRRREEAVGYKGAKTYVLFDPVTLLKLEPSSPLKGWIVLGFVPRLGQPFPSMLFCVYAYLVFPVNCESFLLL
jgi:hypothetical protein